MARRKDDLAARLKKSEAKSLEWEKKCREMEKKYGDLKKLRDAEMQVMSGYLEAR